LHEVRSGKLLGTIPAKKQTNGVYGVTFSPDGKSLAWGNSDGKLYLWDLAADKLSGEMPTGGQLGRQAADDFHGSCLFSPDGTLLAGPGPNGEITICDSAGHKVLTRFEGEDFVGSSLSFSPDGRILAVNGRQARVRLWEINSGKQAGEISGEDGCR